MTYALGPDHVHVTVSYMYNKFKKNECKQGQLIIASWAVHFQNELFSERFCLKPVTSGHTIFGVDEQDKVSGRTALTNSGIFFTTGLIWQSFQTNGKLLYFLVFKMVVP